MSTTKVSDVNPVNVDTRLEVVVVPVSDADRAKDFYEELGWRSTPTRPKRGLPGSPTDPCWLGVLGPIRHEHLVSRSGISPEPVPDRFRFDAARDQLLARAVAVSELFHEGRPAAASTPRAVSSVPLPRVRPTARLRASATRTATAGCSRRSRAGCPAVSTRPPRRSRLSAIWQVRCGAPPRPTASTRSGSVRRTRTGPTGMPRTWWRRPAAKRSRSERPGRRRWLARAALRSPTGIALIAATVLASGVASYDAYVVNVAVPAIDRHFGASLAAIQWTLTSYLLAVAALLLVAGALADHFGRRRVLVAGLLVMVVSSILCASASSIDVLIAARAVQGIGAALVVPTSLALLNGTLRESDRARGSASGPASRRSRPPWARTRAGGSSITRRGAGCSCSTCR